MCRKWTITLAALFTFLSVFSQPSWRVDQLGVRQGLSQGYIYFIRQDKQGFIWVGTHGGLNRYDGYGFRVFQYKPFNFSTLGDNSIFFMEEDTRTGKFWIGSSSCLNEFDPVDFSNKRYYYGGSHLEFSDGVFINKTELLLACEYGVLVFNTETKRFHDVTVLDENNIPVHISRVENTARDRKGNFMVMSRTGIFFYDPATQTCRRKTATSPDLSSFNQHQVFNVLEDQQGFFWIATNRKGLIRFDPRTQQTGSLPLPPPLKSDNLRFDVVMEDSRGKIWAGSSEGLFIIDPHSLQSQFFTSGGNDGASLSHSEINAIWEDHNHYMWIGTVGGGLNKMIPQNSGFNNYPLAAEGGAHAGTYIMGLQEKGGNIWFCNIWDQVGRIDKATGKTVLLSRSQLTPGYSWYSEGSIATDEEGELILLNGENSYLIRADKEKEGLVQQPYPRGLFHIFPSRNGHTYYFVKDDVENIYQVNDTIYSNQFFFDAAEDKAGNIWIGSSEGLVRFTPAKKSFQQFRHDDNNVNSPSSNFIYSMVLDNAEQVIWMAAYNGGLCSYTIETGRFHYYSKKDGLPDNIVYSIEKDHRGNLWFTTNAGISVFETATRRFRNFGVDDGLLNHEFNRRSSYQNKDGWIYFGGISGIDYFHPDSIIPYNTVPNLAFTGFRIFNDEYIPEKDKTSPVIELKNNQRYVTVEFAALDYNDQANIQYAYRFNDDDWILNGNRHILSFSNLAKGKHQLFIRSTNSEGVWLDNEIACTILVHPAWWQTSLFKMGIIAAVFLILLLAIQLYYRRKLEKQKVFLEKKQAIERERTRIATDMHDDLGAGLSRIKFLSETIGIKKQLSQPIEEDIGKIREYSNEMITKMGEIVWALNEKNDSLSDLLAFTRAYAVEYLSQNGIACVAEMPEQLPTYFVSGEFRRNVFLSVKEALHNVVKHAQADSVKLTIKLEDGLRITIEDNGVGLNRQSGRPFSNGLFNMEKRMQDIRGSAAFYNGSGTTVVLSAPLIT